MHITKYFLSKLFGPVYKLQNSTKNAPDFYLFFNNSAQNEPILIIFGIRHPEKNLPTEKIYKYAHLTYKLNTLPSGVQSCDFFNYIQQ